MLGAPRGGAPRKGTGLSRCSCCLQCQIPYEQAAGSRLVHSPFNSLLTARESSGSWSEGTPCTPFTLTAAGKIALSRPAPPLLELGQVFPGAVMVCPG